VSTSQEPASSNAVWTAHHEPPPQETAWTDKHYSTLIDLIRHCDDQIANAHKFHMLSVGSMIPILAILLKIQVPVYAFFATVLLGAALGVRWLTLTSKLNLEKLCWVSLAREVEERYQTDPPGPFSAQEAFFSDLPGYVNSRDKIVMRGIGVNRLYIISIALFTLAVIAVGVAATMGWRGLPF
jgi:hypothetical protein